MSVELEHQLWKEQLEHRLTRIRLEGVEKSNERLRECLQKAYEREAKLQAQVEFWQSQAEFWGARKEELEAELKKEQEMHQHTREALRLTEVKDESEYYAA